MNGSHMTARRGSTHFLVPSQRRGLVDRRDTHELPRKVEYALRPLGHSVGPGGGTAGCLGDGTSVRLRSPSWLPDRYRLNHSHREARLHAGGLVGTSWGAHDDVHRWLFRG